MRELLYQFFAGLTSQEQSQQAELGDGTENFYPDDEGYFTNYPGRTDWYYRPADPIGGVGTPPTTDVAITRVITFRDVRGKEHIVFVRGAVICEVNGNGYRELYTLAGTSYDSGRYFPDMWMHESKLIIANFGDPVLVWNGITGVNPLGVQEIPLPPSPRVGAAPWTLDGVSANTDRGYGPWKYKTFWWPGEPPSNGPAGNVGADAATKVEGMYQMVVQFIDEYGNHGPVSAPSRIARVKSNVDYDSICTTGAYTGTPTYNSSEYLVVDYYPPLIEDHIFGVRVGRTLNLNPDGGAGSEGVYFTNYAYEDTTIGRATLRMSDGTLATQIQIDTDVRGPPQASMGCSFKGRNFLAGLEDPHLVVWSDKDLFGQFRSTNEFRAKDHVRRVAVLADRVVVITRSTIEVLYELNTGEIGILEQDFGNGSTYGRSFVDVGGALFGLWSRGFGFYDGQTLTVVPTPYFISDLYLSRNFYIYSALKKDDWYLVSIRKDHLTEFNNFLLKYHLPTKRWFIVSEAANDLTEWRGAILGCDDSIYELFKGAYTNAAVAVVKGLMPPDANMLGQRSLTNLRLLMEPSSIDNFTITVNGEMIDTEASGGTMHSLPSKQAASRQNHPVPYWNTKFNYEDEHRWSAPGDCWIEGRVERPVSGFSHTVQVTFPAGHKVRLKALAACFGAEARASVT